MVEKGKTYRLDIEGYRAWYTENVSRGVFLFGKSSTVQTNSEPEFRDGEWFVGFGANGIGVGSAPARFLSEV